MKIVVRTDEGSQGLVKEDNVLKNKPNIPKFKIFQ